MNRRDFIKGALLTTGVFATGRSGVFAQEKKGELLRLKNWKNPTPLEQKHVPGIQAPAKVTANKWFDVKVDVGFMQEHPSTHEHWITMIKLLVDGKEVARTDYRTGGVFPSSASFTIELEKTAKIEAVENCNLHGTWISEAVTVVAE